jgi:hypothetical protein
MFVCTKDDLVDNVVEDPQTLHLSLLQVLKVTL